MEMYRYMKPDEIEQRSMEIIAKHLGERAWPIEEAAVIQRCIHTSADFDYADNLVFTPRAVTIGMESIRKGATIITDTQMAASGINKQRLAAYGGTVACFISDERVAREAGKRGVTRSMVSMEYAARVKGPVIVAIGNAPTALIRLYELIEQGKICPELVIGAPVGFVNVVESKELIQKANVPCIVARGNKGGSNIAAAICNAILYQMD